MTETYYVALAEFEKALQKLLDDAIAGGLSAEDVQECSASIIDNLTADEE